MTTTGRTFLMAITLGGLFGVDTAQAGGFDKFLGQVKRTVRSELDSGHQHRPPRCDDPHRCPQPQPYPQPYPTPRPSCHYFLGVWTTLVELVSPEDQTAQPLNSPMTSPRTRVAPGYGEPTYGLRVDRIVEHSPACRGGLEPNDVLLSANGHALRSKQDLTWSIQNSRGQLHLLVLDGRTGQIVTMTIQLERR